MHSEFPTRTGRRIVSPTYYFSFLSSLSPESITHNAYLPQPLGKTAIVSGLNFISRIFALLGEILVRIRVDKRTPPQDQFATARLEEIHSLHTRILTAFNIAPEALRLKPTQMHYYLRPECAGPNFRQTAFAEVREFFDNPKASRENALNPYLVMQANIYVTQVRLHPSFLFSRNFNSSFSNWCAVSLSNIAINSSHRFKYQ
jgi:hypothetical protein